MKCTDCGSTDVWTHDENGNWYCEECCVAGLSVDLLSSRRVNLSICLDSAISLGGDPVIVRSLRAALANVTKTERAVREAIKRAE